jgi:hypothetical protein
MTYPESAIVAAGDATLASHYNNLRADAVLLGKAAADAVSLGTLLERYITRLEVERLDTTKIRVPASATAPVSLLIDGYPCQAVANVDLAAGEVPAGGANAYYIFANRADDSTTFTLTVSTSTTEAANQRRIGRFYWNGTKIIKDSVRSEFAGLVADLLYFVDPQVCNGRLTLSTGVPAPDSDISSSANVYFTPYLGNRVALYVQDYGWRVYSFTELTLDISGIADAKNIDIWIYDDAGTIKLAYTEWSNDTLRATALVRQDGVLCKTGALGYRYLGSVRTSGAGVSCSTKLKRFCINFYNQVPLKLQLIDSTANWSLNSGTWRQMRAQASNKIEFLVALSEAPVFANGFVRASVDATEYAYTGIGLDAVNAVASGANETVLYTSAGVISSILVNSYSGFPGIGYHYLAPIEKTGGNVSFNGNEKHLFKGVIYG